MALGGESSKVGEVAAGGIGLTVEMCGRGIVGGSTKGVTTDTVSGSTLGRGGGG